MIKQPPYEQDDPNERLLPPEKVGVLEDLNDARYGYCVHLAHYITHGRGVFDRAHRQVLAAQNGYLDQCEKIAVELDDELYAEFMLGQFLQTEAEHRFKILQNRFNKSIIRREGRASLLGAFSVLVAGNLQTDSSVGRIINPAVILAFFMQLTAGVNRLTFTNGLVIDETKFDDKQYLTIQPNFFSAVALSQLVSERDALCRELGGYKDLRRIWSTMGSLMLALTTYQVNT